MSYLNLSMSADNGDQLAIRSILLEHAKNNYDLYLNRIGYPKEWENQANYVQKIMQAIDNNYKKECEVRALNFWNDVEKLGFDKDDPDLWLHDQIHDLYNKYYQ